MRARPRSDAARVRWLPIRAVAAAADSRRVRRGLAEHRGESTVSADAVRAGRPSSRVRRCGRACAFALSVTRPSPGRPRRPGLRVAFNDHQRLRSLAVLGRPPDSTGPSAGWSSIALAWRAGDRASARARRGVAGGWSAAVERAGPQSGPTSTADAAAQRPRTLTGVVHHQDRSWPSTAPMRGVADRTLAALPGLSPGRAVGAGILRGDRPRGRRRAVPRAVSPRVSRPRRRGSARARRGRPRRPRRGGGASSPRRLGLRARAGASRCRRTTARSS